MNAGSTTATAWLRGFYVAVITGLLACLTAWQQTDHLKASAITGGIAALSSLLVRGGIEGWVDAGRQKAGDVQPSDVQAGTQGQA